MVVNLATDLAPRNSRELVLANPVLVASGTFGYGIEYARIMDIQRLGGIVSKGTTLRARKGNAMPRIAETHAGMLNSIGLQNPGIHETIRKYGPIWERWQTKVLVNISGEHVDDYAAMAHLLDEAPGIAAIEVNISCPNVDVGGMQFGVDCVMAGEVTAAVRANTTLPVLVKLSPNVTDIVAIAESVVAAGADAITLINTLKGMRIDTKRRRPATGDGRRRPLRPCGEARRGLDDVAGRAGRPGARHRHRGHRHDGGRTGVLHGGRNGDPGRHGIIYQPVRRPRSPRWPPRMA